MIAGADPPGGGGIFAAAGLSEAGGRFGGAEIFGVGGVLGEDCQGLPPGFNMVFGMNPHGPSVGVGFNFVADVEREQVTGKGPGAGFVLQMTNQAHKSRHHRVAHCRMKQQQNQKLRWQIAGCLLPCGDSGALKAAGTLILALATARWLGFTGVRAALAAGVLVLAPHAFNLLDLRPGRAVKAFVLLAGALLAAGGELLALGAFLGPVPIVAFYDLRERGMLGDSGASLLGALAGLWLVMTLGLAGIAFALAALVTLALYGEVCSISALIARVPLLRALDSVGRPA